MNRRLQHSLSALSVAALALAGVLMLQRPLPVEADGASLARIEAGATLALAAIEADGVASLAKVEAQAALSQATIEADAALTQAALEADGADAPDSRPTPSPTRTRHANKRAREAAAMPYFSFAQALRGLARS